MAPIIRVFLRPVLAVALLLAIGACEGDPTAPRAYRQVAGGVEWVAVTVPSGLPGPRAWLPYLEPEVRLEVDRLLNGSATALREGRYEIARELRMDAEQALADGVTAPPARLLFGSLSALEHWCGRVDQAFDLEPPAAVAADVAVVRQLRGTAVEALSRGDTTAAARTLATAGVTVRRYEPLLVALEALPRVESELRAAQSQSEDARRALRLLHNAGEALVAGDEIRALRRTLYALQVASRVASGGPRDP